MKAIFFSVGIVCFGISCLIIGGEIAEKRFKKDMLHECIWRQIKDSHIEQIGRMEQERVSENARFFDDQWKREIAITKDCERAIAAACARLTNQPISLATNWHIKNSGEGYLVAHAASMADAADCFADGWLKRYQGEIRVFITTNVPQIK